MDDEKHTVGRITFPQVVLQGAAPNLEYAHAGTTAELAKLKRQRDALLEALKANEAFVTEMVTLGGKYPFLNGTNIIPDAYAQLKRMSVAIAAVEMEK